MFIPITKENEEKVNKIFIDYGRVIYYVIKQILCDEHLSEDAVYETMHKLMANIDKIKDPESQEARCYIMMAAHHTAYDFYNIRKQETEFMAALRPDDLPLLTPALELEISETLSKTKISQRLSESLKTLSVYDRDILYLKYGRGLPIDGICCMLDITDEVARKRLSRARFRLARHMRAIEEGVEPDEKDALNY